MTDSLRVAVITGGTSGIGLASAELFRKRGWKVVSFSRREGVDVTDEKAVGEALNEVVAEYGRIDALINNAGVGSFGQAEFTEEEIIRKQFEVNFFAAVKLTKKVLPIMRKQGVGHIINVASMAAIFPLPYQSFYSATKAALLNWSRALSGEVEKDGIRLSVVCPGDVQTGFTDARIAKEESSSLNKAEQAERGGMRPEAIAREIVKLASMKKPPLVAVPGLGYAWLDRFARLLPRTWVSKLITRFYT